MSTQPIPKSVYQNIESGVFFRADRVDIIRLAMERGDKMIAKLRMNKRSAQAAKAAYCEEQLKVAKNPDIKIDERFIAAQHLLDYFGIKSASEQDAQALGTKVVGFSAIYRF